MPYYFYVVVIAAREGVRDKRQRRFYVSIVRGVKTRDGDSRQTDSEELGTVERSIHVGGAFGQRRPWTADFLCGTDRRHDTTARRADLLRTTPATRQPTSGRGSTSTRSIHGHGHGDNEDLSSRTAAAVNKSKDATPSTRPEDGRAADRRSVTRVRHVQSVQ